MKKLTYASLFAGIGGFESGLNALGMKNVFASEIDKFARKAYEALYGVEPSGDITKIDSKDIPDHDLLTAGFPCQAFSVAGKQAGMAYVCKECQHEQTISFQQYADREFTCEKCSGKIEAVDGRGLLFFEVARIARDKQPKVLLLENVKGLVGHDKGRTLDTIVKTLSEIGYVVDFEVLNSKFFGVPQNRERIFIVAIREDIQPHEEWAEESLKGNTVVPKGKRRIKECKEVKMFNFDFPTNNKVTKRLRDAMETEVDERFYLDEEKTAALVAELESKSSTNKLPILEVTTKSSAILSNVEKFKDICIDDTQGFDGTRVYYDETPTIRSQRSGLKVVEDIRAVLTPDRLEKRQNGRRFKEVDEEMFTLTIQDGHRVLEEVPEALPMECEGIIPLGELNMKGHRTVKTVHSPEGQCPTLTTMGGGHREPKIAQRESKTYRIRKLTPKECWRLQGFTDEQHDTVEAVGISNSQRYKQAGNAVTVNVIKALGESIIKHLKGLK